MALYGGDTSSALRRRGNPVLLAISGLLLGGLVAYAGLFTPLPFALPTILLVVGCAWSWRRSRVFAISFILAGLVTLAGFFWLFATFSTGID